VKVAGRTHVRHLLGKRGALAPPCAPMGSAYTSLNKGCLEDAPAAIVPAAARDSLPSVVVAHKGAVGRGGEGGSERLWRHRHQVRRPLEAEGSLLIAGAALCRLKHNALGRT